MDEQTIAAYVKGILAHKPEEFTIHGYTTYDDSEELIERLGTHGIECLPVLAFRHRGSSTLTRPKVELRIELRLKYPVPAEPVTLSF